MFDDFVRFVRNMYKTEDLIFLHEPRFLGNEKKYVLETIDSTIVSSVGEFVNHFERKVAEFTGSKHAIATVNGTSALHIILKLLGVEQDTEVITQSLTFVATCNAIRYCGATPVFVDVERSTLGLSPESLEAFLEGHCEIRNDGCCWNRTSNKRVCACMPMHTFGFPVQLDKLKQVCDRYNIKLVEDAAESLGSYYRDQHTGNFGEMSAFSLNGNKIITTGGGGMVVTNDDELARRAKHLITTAKLRHRWDFKHDEIGFNYRMPNLNASLGLAQLESLPDFIKSKRWVAKQYQEWGKKHDLPFIVEPKHTRSNYWLNVAITKDRQQRDALLEATNKSKVMTRPAWVPMHMLKINQDCQKGELTHTEWLFERLVSVPSSAVANGE